MKKIIQIITFFCCFQIKASAEEFVDAIGTKAFGFSINGATIPTGITTYQFVKLPPEETLRITVLGENGVIKEYNCQKGIPVNRAKEFIQKELRCGLIVRGLGWKIPEEYRTHRGFTLLETFWEHKPWVAVEVMKAVDGNLNAFCRKEQLDSNKEKFSQPLKSFFMKDLLRTGITKFYPSGIGCQSVEIRNDRGEVLDPEMTLKEYLIKRHLIEILPQLAGWHIPSSVLRVLTSFIESPKLERELANQGLYLFGKPLLKTEEK